MIKQAINIILILIFISCQKEEIETSSAYPASGYWIVNEYDTGGMKLYGPYELQIYNTSFSDDSIWIDNIYGMDLKVKAKLSLEHSFDGSGLINTNITSENKHIKLLDISNSAIINNDSIYFEVVMYDTLGNVYSDLTISGTRATGFE